MSTTRASARVRRASTAPRRTARWPSEGDDSQSLARGESVSRVFSPTRHVTARTLRPPPNTSLIPPTLTRRHTPEVKVRGVLEYLRARGASVGRHTQRYTAARYISHPDISSNTVSSARQKRSARTLFKHCRLTRDDPAFPADKAPRLAPRWSRASLTASRNARLRGRSCPGSISASPRRGSTPTDSPSAPRTTGSSSSTPAGPERRASRSRCRPGFSNPRGRSGWRRGACRPRRRPCRPA